MIDCLPDTFTFAPHNNPHNKLKSKTTPHFETPSSNSLPTLQSCPRAQYPHFDTHGQRRGNFSSQIHGLAGQEHIRECCKRSSLSAAPSLEHVLPLISVCAPVDVSPTVYPLLFGLPQNRHTHRLTIWCLCMTYLPYTRPPKMSTRLGRPVFYHMHFVDKHGKDMHEAFRINKVSGYECRQYQNFGVEIPQRLKSVDHMTMFLFICIFIYVTCSTSINFSRYDWFSPLI